MRSPTRRSVAAAYQLDLGTLGNVVVFWQCRVGLDPETEYIWRRLVGSR